MGVVVLKKPTVVKQANIWPSPGEWRATRDHEKQRFALYCCPGCGTTCQMGNTKYRVLRDGTVTPQFECTVEDCGFQENIRLEGWVDKFDDAKVKEHDNSDFPRITFNNEVKKA